MTEATRQDAWTAGEDYDAYMGRWSRMVAPRFLDWLGMPPGLDWLDVGCGTGALSESILARGRPSSLIGLDASEALVATAADRLRDTRATFRTGRAEATALPAASRDAVVSGLVLNFLPDAGAALAEMRRVARPGGVVALYVWDFPGGAPGFVDAFWSAATALDPGAADLAQSRRFAWCRPEVLAGLLTGAGLERVASGAIEIETVFRDFDDFWTPFTLGTGPAPGYCAGLAPDHRDRLRERLEAALPPRADGALAMPARAWTLRAARPRDG